MIYRRVLKYYRGFLGRSLIALAFSFAAIGLNLLKPWPFKIIVDQILPGRLKVFQCAIPPSFGGAIKTPVLDSVQAIGLLCLAMVIIQLLWSLLSFASTYMFVKIGLESLFRLRTELYAHLQRLSLKFHDTRRSTDSSFRVAYDSQSIQTIYNKGFSNVIARSTSRFHRIPGHALSTARIAHLHCVGNGRRNSRSAALFRNSRLSRRRRRFPERHRDRKDKRRDFVSERELLLRIGP